MNSNKHEFLLWIEEHREKFATYSTNEILDLAEAVGFDRAMASQYLTSIKFHVIQ